MDRIKVAIFEPGKPGRVSSTRSWRYPVRELTPEERIELRIDVNLKGLSIEDAAIAYGVTEERVRDLCNIPEGERKVVKNNEIKYRVNRSVDEHWPALAQWLRDNDYNLAALSRICDLNPNVITNAMINGRLFKGNYNDAIRRIVAHTGVADPRGACAYV